MIGFAGTVLGIDTAGPVVGAAIWSAAGPGPEWSRRAGRGADEALLPALAELIAGQRIDRVAVSIGPGTFTGLRVGVAAALGLAMSLELGVVCVDALSARAALVEGDRVLSVLDARKGRVYAALYRSQAGWLETLVAAQDVELSQLLPAAPFLAVGEGAVVFRAIIEEAGGTVAPQAERCPAAQVARLGAAGSPVDPAAVQLQYLRGADAVVPAGLGQRHGA